MKTILFITFLALVALAHEDLQSNIFHNTVSSLNQFSRHLVGKEKECPPFNPNDFSSKEEWDQLNVQEKAIVKEFYDSLCALMKRESSPTRNLATSSGKKVVRIGVLNDIHFDPYYDPAVGKDKFCRSVDPFESKRVVT